MKHQIKYQEWIKQKVWRSWRLILQYTIAPSEIPKEKKSWWSWHSLLRYHASPTGSEDKKKVWQSWRLLIQYATKPFRSGGKALRHTFSGRIGLRSVYVIHTGPPIIPKENMNDQISTLVKDSALRFQEGAFFSPIADQVDHSHAIVTGRLAQGEQENRADAIFAVFPVN